MSQGGYRRGACRGSVGFVLLIACLNVANLLLARGAIRQRERAVTALGLVSIAHQKAYCWRERVAQPVFLSLFFCCVQYWLSIPAVPRIEQIGIDAFFDKSWALPDIEKFSRTYPRRELAGGV